MKKIMPAIQKIIGIKELDEREEQIVGQASKIALVVTLGSLMVLLVLSIFRYGEVVEAGSPERIELKEVIGISKTSLMLVLTAVSLVAFHVSARRRLGNFRLPMLTLVALMSIAIAGAKFHPKFVKRVSFSELLARAQAGDANAQNEIGEMYLFGNGVSQNFGAAMAWFKKSSDQGNSVAPNHIGRLYLNGEGVVRDEGEACKWYRLSAQRGDPAGVQNARKCPST